MLRRGHDAGYGPTGAVRVIKQRHVQLGGLHNAQHHGATRTRPAGS
jgi:hypothetical protein